MKNIIWFLSVVILASCSSSNDVVHNGFLQKRKYNKGYNLSFRKSKENPKENKEELFAKERDNKSPLSEIEGKELVFLDTLELELIDNRSLVASARKESSSLEYVSVYEKQLNEFAQKIDESRNSLKLKENEGENEQRKGLGLFGLILLFLGLATIVLGVVIGFGWGIPAGLTMLLLGVVLKVESKKPKKNTEAYRIIEEQKQEKQKEQEAINGSDHLQEQQKRMKRARETKVVGLAIGVFLVTLPITLILFVTSLNNLLRYVDHRKANDSEDTTQIISKLTKRMKLLRILLYVSMVFGVVVGLAYFSTLAASFSALFGLSWVLFLGILIYLTILYFKLFALIKKEDKI